jgi:hypothetical protein
MAERQRTLARLAARGDQTITEHPKPVVHEPSRGGGVI